MNSLNSIITNSFLNIDGKQYAGIIGLNPSQGARSPKLWNKVYQTIDSNIRMYPFDVETNKIDQLLFYLNNDKNFVGGSIAVPHKISIFNILKNNLSSDVQSIGAINCLYRDQNGALTGSNTDGEGAIESIKTLIGRTAIKNVLILGTGGTAKAIASNIRQVLERSGRLVVAYNVNKMFNTELEQFGVNDQIQFEEIYKEIKKVDLLINATILGGTQAIGISPLPIEIVKQLPRTSFVFDVNYQPEYTRLIEFAEQQNLKTMNGKMMNLLQAVLGYQYVNPEIVKLYNKDYIKKQMEKAINEEIK